MIELMYKNDGIGLAANQIGINKKVCVVHIPKREPLVFINPRIVSKEQEITGIPEGCLSFPFLFLSINRPKWCSVKYTDQHGKEIEETLHGMSARVFQHENEHMNGYVFTDLVSKFKLERAEKAKIKMLKDYARGGAIQ